MKARIERKIRQGIPGSVQEVEHHIKEIDKNADTIMSITQMSNGEILRIIISVSTPHITLWKAVRML